MPEILSHSWAPPRVKVYPGAFKPSHTDLLEGDNAFSEDGVGGVFIPRSSAPYETQHAVDFILETLSKYPEKTVSLTASGPLTNIAVAYLKAPEIMHRMKQMVIMGGCTHDMPARDRPIRRGNISYHAEFNFQQAAEDAHTVMNSGLPIVLLPMNCTYGLCLNPERQERVLHYYKNNPVLGQGIINLCAAPEFLDRMKFGLPATLNDVNCALYLLEPDLYETTRGSIEVLQHDGLECPHSYEGYSDFKEHPDGPLTVATRLKDSDRAFNILMQSFTVVLPQHTVTLCESR